MAVSKHLAQIRLRIPWKVSLNDFPVRRFPKEVISQRDDRRKLDGEGQSGEWQVGEKGRIKCSLSYKETRSRLLSVRKANFVAREKLQFYWKSCFLFTVGGNFKFPPSRNLRIYFRFEIGARSIIMYSSELFCSLSSDVFVKQQSTLVIKSKITWTDFLAREHFAVLNKKWQKAKLMNGSQFNPTRDHLLIGIESSL